VGALSATRGSQRRIAWTGKKIDQSGRSRADDAADRPRIYGPARKSAPDEHGYKAKEREGSNSTFPRTVKAEEVITTSRL